MTMAEKQYHFRCDDDDLNASIAHEAAKHGRSTKDLLVELLRRGLEQVRRERDEAARFVYEAQQVANPGRVIYSDDAAKQAASQEGEQ